MRERGLGGGRPQSRVDPDEQQPEAGADQVGHLGVPERFQLRPSEPHILIIAGARVYCAPLTIL
jgi:hypothetical protein